MAKPAQGRTRRRVAQARLLLARGHSRIEAREALMSEFEISRRSALRTLEMAEEQFEAELKAKRHQLRSKQLAKLLHAQRLALSSPDGPDLAALVAILREQNKILGLHLPELEGGDQWESLPIILRPVQIQEHQVESPTNGSAPTPGSSPYSRRNGSS